MKDEGTIFYMPGLLQKLYGQEDRGEKEAHPVLPGMRQRDENGGIQDAE